MGGEKIQTILKAAGVDVEPYWPGLFAKALESCNVKELITNVGSGVEAAPAAGGAAPAAGGAAAAEEKKEEKKKSQKKNPTTTWDSVSSIKLYVNLLSTWIHHFSYRRYMCSYAS